LDGVAVIGGAGELTDFGRDYFLEKYVKYWWVGKGGTSILDAIYIAVTPTSYSFHFLMFRITVKYLST